MRRRSSRRYLRLFSVFLLCVLSLPLFGGRAALALDNPPVATITPKFRFVCLGFTETFQATYSDTPAAPTGEDQWFVNGVAVPGSVGSTLSYTFTDPKAYVISHRFRLPGNNTWWWGQWIWEYFDCGFENGCQDTPKVTPLPSPRPGCVGEAITFTVTSEGLRTPQGACYHGPVRYLWDFTNDGGIDAEGASVYWTFGLPGTYPVLVKAVDGNGNVLGTGTVTEPIHLCDPPPPPPGGSLKRYPQPGVTNGPVECAGEASINLFTGNLHTAVADPVATRGFPLVNNVHLSSQSIPAAWQIETPRAMGNATFTYDIRLIRQRVYDANCQYAEHWMLVDGDGARWDYGATSGAPVTPRGAFGTLTATMNGYTLANTGPPESIWEAGNFTYTFESVGNGTYRLASLTDPTLNVQNVAYNGAGKIQSVTDVETGKVLTFEYDGNGRIEFARQGGGRQTSVYGYDGQGRLTSISIRQDGMAELTRRDYTYNADGTLLTIKRDGNNATLVTYSYTQVVGWDCATNVPLANGQSAGLQIDTNIIWNRPPVSPAFASVWVKNAQNGETRYDFDTFGNLFLVVSPAPYGHFQPIVTSLGYTPN